MEAIKAFLSTNVLSILSRLIALYFLWAFHLLAGFPPKADLTASSTTYLVLFVFFVILPFAQRLKLGELLEFEAKVEEVKTEVGEFKTETRELLAVYNTLANTISNTVNQSVVVNLPGQEEIEEAREGLSQAIDNPEDPLTVETEVDEYLLAQGADPNYALARLRMDLERELRRILGKRLETRDPTRIRGQFLGAHSLFRRFAAAQPKYQSMGGSFDYVLKVCNAAIHGQRIHEGHAHEALQMGLQKSARASRGAGDVSSNNRRVAPVLEPVGRSPGRLHRIVRAGRMMG